MKEITPRKSGIASRSDERHWFKNRAYGSRERNTAQAGGLKEDGMKTLMAILIIVSMALMIFLVKAGVESNRENDKIQHAKVNIGIVIKADYSQGNFSASSKTIFTTDKGVFVLYGFKSYDKNQPVVVEELEIFR